MESLKIGIIKVSEASATSVKIYAVSAAWTKVL
jgi:hypothetical protein